MSLETAKRFVQDRLDDGVTCPCCGQYAKRYKRKLNSGMARALIWLVKEHEKTGDWVDFQGHAPAELLRTKQLATTRYWDLVEQMPKDPSDTGRKTSGHWRPTQDGIDFVHDRISLSRHVFVYNNEVQAFSEELTDIRRALGSAFNYEELMHA